MSQPKPSRREMLEDFVAKNPKDAFARYALAMECMQAGESAMAEQHFRALLERHPEYVPGYFHFGQLLAELGRTEEARQVLQSGVAAARRAGNAHALSEMEAALQNLHQPASG